MDDKAKPEMGYFDNLSAVSRYIRMYKDVLWPNAFCERDLFFVMSADGPVLVTNRHNFTGRNNFTDKTLNKKCWIPDHAVVTLHGPKEIHYHIDKEANRCASRSDAFTLAQNSERSS